MAQSLPLILQLTDSCSRRKALLRLDDWDAQTPTTLGQLLDEYLRHCPAENLLRSEAITPESLRSLQAMQDLVYACDELGRITGMFTGIVFRQRGRPVGLEAEPILAQARSGDMAAVAIDLEIDRTNVENQRNWAGFHRRRWDRDSALFSEFVHSALVESYGASEAERTIKLDSRERRLKFIESLARRVWRSDFENYSRFTGERLMFKAGDETVRNIAAGAGGICAEKVQALKFLTDHYDLPSEYLIGGDNASGALPVNKLREMLLTFDFSFAKRYMRYWQHTALLYQVDDVPILVDATNGNIPFLFLQGAEAESLLAAADPSSRCKSTRVNSAPVKMSVPVKMVEAEENYYYHRTPQDIPENLFFALEGWLSDTDMVQVFENELGLYLSQEFYIAPLPYRNQPEYERLRQEYLTICRRANLYGAVNRDWSLDFPLGRDFAAANPQVAEKILEAKDHLLHRYNEWDRPGHNAGLAIIRLSSPCPTGI